MLNKSEILKKLIQEYDVKTTRDVQEMLKDLFAETIQEMLEAELDEHLGYDRYDNQNKNTTNSRNGHRNKKVRSDFGEVGISIPRDRQGSFEPRIIKNYENDISGIEEQIIGMYSKGMSTRDISAHINSIYGIDVSHSLVSKITDRVLPLAKEWQNRALDTIYPVIFMDAIHYKVRTEGRIVNRAAYIAIGINLDGIKEVLGIWIGQNESSKYWLSVLNGLKNRGVKDILIICADGLTGIKEAIAAAYPNTEYQRCIVHQVRNTMKYVSEKDKKPFCTDLKTIYHAPTEEKAVEALERVTEKWSKKYPNSMKSWKQNWDAISPIFKFSADVRKVIYTTNAIESLNATYRKLNRQRSVFPSDTALLKALYLSTFEATKKWTMPLRNWGQVYGELSIMYEGRLPE